MHLPARQTLNSLPSAPLLLAEIRFVMILPSGALVARRSREEVARLADCLAFRC